MTREIPLTRGHIALVDDADFEFIRAEGPWHARVDRCGVVYAKHSYTSSTSVFMHTVLTGWSLVDHINRNGLDNRRCNLRPATRSQNVANSRIRSDNRSGFKGVYQYRDGVRWVAQAGRQYLGIYATAESAARAYDAAALELYGDFALINFPKQERSA